MILKLDPASPLWLVLTMLAGWRLTSLICYETGPFGVLVGFRRICYRAGLGSLVDCFQCASFWIAAVLTVLVYRPELEAVLVGLAVAGGISVIENSTTGKRLPERDES